MRAPTHLEAQVKGPWWRWASYIAPLDVLPKASETKPVSRRIISSPCLCSASVDHGTVE